MLRAALALGWRAATRPGARGRTVGRALIGLLAALAVLGVATAPTVVRREGARLERLQALDADLRPEAAAVHQARPDGSRVIVVLVEPGAVGSMPGLAGDLPPGTVRLSPALARAVADDATLGRWFPQRRLGDLGPGAVGTAGELTAYVGVDTGGAASAVPAQQPFVTPNPPATFGAYQLAGFLVFLGLPAIGLLVLGARLGADARRQRFAALRLVGMSGAAVRAGLALELAVAVVPGAAVAAALALGPWPDALVLPVVGRWVFAGDARLPTAVVIGLALAVVVVSAALGAATTGERHAGRVRDRVLGADPTRPWVAVVYLAGLALAVAAAVSAAPNDDRRFVATILVGVGLPAAVALGVRVVARVLGRRQAGVPWLVATRTLAASPRRLSRVAGVVSVVVLGGLVAQPIAQARSGGPPWVDEAHEAGRAAVSAQIQLPLGVPLEVPLDEPPDGVAAVLPRIVLRSADGATTTEAVVATCAELDLAAGPTTGCTGRPRALHDPVQGDVVPAPPGLVLSGAGGAPAALVAVEAGVVTIDAGDTPWPALVVPPEVVAGVSPLPATGANVVVEPTDEAWAAAQGWVVAHQPVATLASGSVPISTSDATPAWVAAGLQVAATFALAGAVTSLLDARADRRRWWSLRVLGMPGRAVIGTAALTSGIAAAVGLVAAVVPATLLIRAWLAVGDETPTSYAPYVAIPLVGAALVVVVGVAGAWSEVRAARPR